MRDLHEHAAAVAGLRVGTDGAAMIEVQEDLQTHLDNRMGLAALHIGDKAYAAGIFFKRWIVRAGGRGKPRIAQHIRFRRRHHL